MGQSVNITDWFVVVLPGGSNVVATPAYFGKHNATQAALAYWREQNFTLGTRNRWCYPITWRMAYQRGYRVLFWRPLEMLAVIEGQRAALAKGK